MVKRIKKITKGNTTRERKKLIVVGTEGRNQTETQYLRRLEKKQKQYHFVFAEGNATDPVSIVKNAVKKAGKEEISIEQGDMVICLFDLDLDDSKINQLQNARAISQKRSVWLITSNPCFEIWYLEHFKYTTKPFNSSDELIHVLKNYLPQYSKSEDCFDRLYPHTMEAENNCRKLDAYHKENAMIEPFEYNNPRTDVYKLIELLL